MLCHLLHNILVCCLEHTVQLHIQLLVFSSHCHTPLTGLLLWVLINIKMTLIFLHLLEDLATCWFSCWTYWQALHL